jgi:hypothetical protein
VGIFCDVSVNLTASGAYPVVTSEVNCATGTDASVIGLVVFASVELPEESVLLIVVLWAGTRSGIFSVSVGVAGLAGPVFGRACGGALYSAGSSGISAAGSPDIPGLLLFLSLPGGSEQPLVQTSIMTRMHARVPDLYIVNFESLYS